MKHIVLPDNKPRRLVFYLAMEEYVARNLDEKECFFMWQVAPTVPAIVILPLLVRSLTL